MDSDDCNEMANDEMESKNSKYYEVEPQLQKVDYLSDDDGRDDTRCLWTRNATLELIELYKEFAPLVGKCSKVKNMKELWTCICNKLQDKGFFFTPEQVGNKWKVLRRTYKASIDKKRRHASIYINDLDPILRDEIKPSKPSSSYETNIITNEETVVMEALEFVDGNPTETNWQNQSSVDEVENPLNYEPITSQTPTSALILIRNQMQQHHRERIAVMRERNIILEERNRIRAAELVLEREREEHRHQEKTTLLNVLKQYLEQKNN